ncbi:MAG: hypothetical protein M1475_00655 [Actinobacteria bacterium]|nr:hypothetical protein [Actinomycetota bacterium]
MYKCLDCGNTEKFIGHAQEKGIVLIYRNDDFDSDKTQSYSWVYNVSEKSWDFSMTVDKCYFCNSKNILKI